MVLFFDSHIDVSLYRKGVIRTIVRHPHLFMCFLQVDILRLKYPQNARKISHVWLSW